MLNFKFLEKIKIEEYRKFYNSYISLGYDANPLNVYLWRNESNIKMTVLDDTLIKAYFSDDGTILSYCMPVGKNVKNAVVEIFKDAYERGTYPNFVLLTVEQKKALDRLYPDKFIYKPTPEYQDYIYRSSDLAQLSGRKFHSKRNHISRFYSKYKNVRFIKINETNKTDAIRVVLDWYKEKGLSLDSADFEPLKDALENMEGFNMSGAILYVDLKPVAMTLGSEISSYIYDINFEKALREYDGAYAVINQEFAKTLTDYEYINREEDMGIEGLRKAKLSYHPAIILERHTAEVKL